MGAQCPTSEWSTPCHNPGSDRLDEDQCSAGVVGDGHGTVFHGYIEQCVLSTPEPCDIMFMENLSAHNVTGLEELIRSNGAHLIYLPPYSADFNPIELACFKVKTILSRLKARTLPDSIKTLKQALQAITTQDIHG